MWNVKGRGSSLSWGVPKEPGLRGGEWNWGAPTEGGLRSTEWNNAEPIHTEKHWWDWGVLIQADEHQKRVGKGYGMHYRSPGGNWRASILGWGACIREYKVLNGIEKCWERRNWLLNEIEEVESRLRSSDENWGAPVLVEFHCRGGG